MARQRLNYPAVGGFSVRARPHHPGKFSFESVEPVGNLAVVIAAGLVAWTSTPWPDLAVAAVVAGLFLQSAWSIVRDARGDLRDAKGRGPAYKKRRRLT